jgi:hypothetical protein
MTDEKPLDADEVREDMHSAVERIRERLPEVIGREPEPELLKDVEPTG